MIKVIYTLPIIKIWWKKVMKKIFLLLILANFHLDAHWFDISPEISDSALKKLSDIRNFGGNSSIAIHPISPDHAIAITHDKNPGWFSSSYAYFSYFYDGDQWSEPHKICDYTPETLIATPNLP
jgi:hypothetical protein